MTETRRLTAEQFAETRYDLPESGRWIELVAGQLVTLQPPDMAHGTAVLNLSKAIAVYAQGPNSAENGYACFELGLVVARNPDTIRCPAMSWFAVGELFAEMDKPVSEVCPVLVVEIASSNDRRKGIAQRIEEYHAWGVESVWVLDPINLQVHVASRGGRAKSYSSGQSLIGSPALPGFRIQVDELFAEPKWWLG